MIHKEALAIIHQPLSEALERMKAELAEGFRTAILDRTMIDAIALAIPQTVTNDAISKIGDELRRVVRTAVDQEMLVIRLHLHRIAAVVLSDVPTDC